MVERVCAELGIEAVRLGGEQRSIDTAPAMAATDIVMGYGRCIVEAMAAGRAAYVYDHNGGDGWVTPDSYERLEADGFGGQATARALDAAQLRDDLAAYRPEMGTQNRDLAVANHAANRHAAAFGALLAELAGAPHARPDAPWPELARLIRQLWDAEGRAAGFAQHAADLRERLNAAEARASELEREVRLLERSAAEFKRTRRYRAVAALARPADALRSRLRTKHGALPSPAMQSSGAATSTSLGSGFFEIVEAERELAEPDILQVGSMLSFDERMLLRWATRAGNPSADAVVDAGCFLGGSTLALASGVAARATAPSPIHVYDLFRYGDASEKAWVPDGLPFAVGASTMPAFEQHVRRVRPMLTLHAGDVREKRWDGEPIGTLFVDIAKSWSTGDAVWNQFFPALVPGESLVIQQDLVHWGHPWCAIVMELLDEHFEYLGWTWYSSAVYRTKRPVTRGDLPRSLLRDVSPDDKLALPDRAAERLGEPIAGSVRLSGAVVLAAHGRFEPARERVDAIRAAYGDEHIPYISEGYAYLDNWIAGVENGTIAVA
jgi:hypothetical protein